MVDTEQEKVSYNIAGMHAKGIAHSLNRSSHYFMVGDLGNWLASLSNIHERVFYKMEDPQRIIFDELHKNCRRYINSWYTWRKLDNNGEEIPKEILINKQKLAEQIKIYSRELSKELDTQGWYPSKAAMSAVSFE